MTDNYIPAAKSFRCTHGRRGIFLLRLEQNSETELWSWHMVFAGHPTVCPPHLQDAFSSPQEYVSAQICAIAAEQQAYALSAVYEDWYLKNRSLLRSAACKVSISPQQLSTCFAGRLQASTEMWSRHMRI